MMSILNTLKVLALITSVAMSLGLAAGLFRPWLMLWWRDTQTRIDVIKLYGIAAALSYFVYWLLKSMR